MNQSEPHMWKVVASAIFPGLGQLFQMRIGTFFLHLFLGMFLWCFFGWMLGGIIAHVYSAYEAHQWETKNPGA